MFQPSNCYSIIPIAMSIWEILYIDFSFVTGDTKIGIIVINANLFQYVMNTLTQYFSSRYSVQDLLINMRSQRSLTFICILGLYGNVNVMIVTNRYRTWCRCVKLYSVTIVTLFVFELI